MDIVERLRTEVNIGSSIVTPLRLKAADEIERLREERDKLKEALRSLIALTATALKENE